MKIKSIAMLAMTGLFTAAIAHAAPAFSDDMSGSPSSTTMQPPADPNMPSQPTEMSNMPAGGDSLTNNANDDASPDTATGDDDY